MSDDPREILAEAGVECPELTEVWGEYLSNTDHGYYAIRALARLVAKYKWQRDAFIRDYAENEVYLFDAQNKLVAELVAALDRRWEKR